MSESAAPSTWLDFWNADHSIYVSRRHRDAHARRLLDDVSPLLPTPPFTLLDYGCGDALTTPGLVARGGRVLLYERAPVPRAHLARRFAGTEGVAVLDDDGLAAVAPGSCDLVLLVSVLQYLDDDALARVLAAIRPLLAPAGRLVIGDVVRPDTGMPADAFDLLAFAGREGFLAAALWGLARTLVSDYRTVRKRAGFSTWRPEALAARLAELGWEGEVLARNIGHSRHRFSMAARPRRT